VISEIQEVGINTNKIGLTILKEWITLDSRNAPSTTNIEEEKIVDAPGNDGNSSMPELVKRPNASRRRKKKKKIIVRNVLSVYQPVNPNV
jgi:hypothetical protein